jgi:hypothetical protein
MMHPQDVCWQDDVLLVRWGETHILKLFASEDEALLVRKGEICIPMLLTHPQAVHQWRWGTASQAGQTYIPPAFDTFSSCFLVKIRRRQSGGRYTSPWAFYMSWSYFLAKMRCCWSGRGDTHLLGVLEPFSSEDNALLVRLGKDIHPSELSYELASANILLTLHQSET